MATIAKPQVQVFQEFNVAPTEQGQPMRALIAGGNALLHRYASEKTDIPVGAYDRLEDSAYSWPGRSAGGKVDQDSVRLFADAALLLYFEDLIDQVSAGKGTIAPVEGKKNQVISSVTNFKTHGDYSRSSLLYDRDVAIGDRVYLRGVFDPDGECEEIEFWSYVAGLSAELGDGTVDSCAADTSNAETTTVATEGGQISGTENCVTATPDPSDYDGLASGQPTETYTIEVVKSSVSGCVAARLRVTSASGTDNVEEVTPEAMGVPTAIGTLGFTVTWDVDTGACEDASEEAGVVADEFLFGQKWQFAVSQDFEPGCCSAAGAYDGDSDDVYIVEVTKGGLWADLPEVTVRTVKGLDVSGPVVVSDDAEDVPIGTHGVTLQFIDCWDDSVSAASAAGDVFGGDSSLAGLCLGDKYYVTVSSGTDGPARTILLRHDLPLKLRSSTDLDLRLFIPVNDLEISQSRVTEPPLTNYEFTGTTQITVNAAITLYHEDWTDGGDPLPLTLYAGDLYVEYREWVPTLAAELAFMEDIADLDDIPGVLAVANPLKYGVYLALLNSNGTSVAYIAVADPDDPDSWAEVLERTEGRDDIYNLVPLTYDATAIGAFQAHVNSESSPEAAAWKAMFVGLESASEKMIVGLSDESDQVLNPTSTDGEIVLATIEDNPDADDTQYTLLHVPDGNSGFTTYEVAPGDIVRFIYTVDAFGLSEYSEFVVDEVLSETSLLLLAGPTAPVTVAQKMEIWHPYTKTQIAEAVATKAASYGDRRVCAVWPDVAGAGGDVLPSYFLACIAAGLRSGVMPHQPLTNVAVRGVDELAARTTKFFSETQLNILQDAGVWIMVQDRIGTPHNRHALTTDVSLLAKREESQRTNLDSLSFYFKNLISPYIGVANVSRDLLNVLEYQISVAVRYLTTNQASQSLGPRLISASVAVDSRGIPIFRQHPLNADVVEIVLNLVLPAPLNTVQLHLVV